MPFLSLGAVLFGWFQGTLPASAEGCFRLLYSDESTFVYRYRGVRKDSDLEVSAGCLSKCIYMYAYMYVYMYVNTCTQVILYACAYVYM